MKDDTRTASRYRPSLYAAPFRKAGDGAPVELLCEAEQQAILDISRMLVMRPHTVVYAQGGETTHVYNVVSGVAQTYQLTVDGGRRVTSFVFPGDIIGLSQNGTYIDTAQSLTPVVLFKIPVDRLPDLIADNEGLDVDFMSKICHDLRRSQRHAITLSTKDASSRLANFLLWVDNEHRYPGKVENELFLPMKRHDIADYVGLSVESVSRTFKVLEEAGAIQRKGARGVTILNRGALEKFAGEL